MWVGLGLHRYVNYMNRRMEQSADYETGNRGALGAEEEEEALRGKYKLMLLNATELLPSFGLNENP